VTAQHLTQVDRLMKSTACQFVLNVVWSILSSVVSHRCNKSSSK